MEIGKPFRVISLTDNVAWITAIGNDYSFDDAFVRQLANYGQAGDVLITVSVSGNSPNLVKALEWAKEHDVRTLALVGAKRGRCAELAKHDRRRTDCGQPLAADVTDEQAHRAR